MQLEFVKPTKEMEAEILAFKQSFFAAGETVINGGAGLDFYESLDEWLAYLAAVERGEDCFVPSHVWFCRRPGSTQLLGVVDIRPDLPEEKRHFGHIGYAVTPAARGQGIATAMVGWGMQRLAASGLAELLACCYESNLPSYRTLEKCGFVRCGAYKEEKTGFTIVNYRCTIEG